MALRKKPGSQQGSQLAKVKADVDAFMIEREIDRTNEYIQQGRRFQSTTIADLNAKWIAAIKQRAANPTDSAPQKLADDLEVEMTIRGLTAPYDDVKAESEAFIAYVNGMTERVNAHPEQWREANEELQADIDAVKAKNKAAPKN